MTRKNPHLVPSETYPNIKLIREFLSYDMRFDLLARLTDKGIYNSNELGMLSLDLISTFHWSRQYELPWAIEVSDLKPTDVVLDAGCSYSSLKFAIAKRCKKIYGIDIDLESLSTANDMCSELGIDNIELIKGDLIEFDTFIRFDKIFLLSVIEHVEGYDNIIKGFRNLVRLLKPGGTLIVTMDVADKKIHNFNIDRPDMNNILEHFNYTKEDLTLLLDPKPVRMANFTDKYGANTNIFAICFVYTKPLE